MMWPVETYRPAAPSSRTLKRDVLRSSRATFDSLKPAPPNIVKRTLVPSGRKSGQAYPDERPSGDVSSTGLPPRASTRHRPVVQDGEKMIEPSGPHAAPGEESVGASQTTIGSPPLSETFFI